MGKWEKRSSSLLGGGMCLVPHLPAPQPVGMTLPQTPSNPWPSEVADTLHSEASYCPWATTTQDGLSKHRGGHQGWSGGVLIARSRPRCPSRSCTPGVPNRIYWHRKQFLGPPPSGPVHSPWAASLSTIPQAPALSTLSIATNPAVLSTLEALLFTLSLQPWLHFLG